MNTPFQDALNKYVPGSGIARIRKLCINKCCNCLLIIWKAKQYCLSLLSVLLVGLNYNNADRKNLFIMFVSFAATLCKITNNFCVRNRTLILNLNKTFKECNHFWSTCIHCNIYSIRIKAICMQRYEIIHIRKVLA